MSDSRSPSITPTILITFFFGLFGLIPAAIAASEAGRRDESGGRYWGAFGSIIAVQVGGFVLLLVGAPLWVTVAAVWIAGGMVWAAFAFSTDQPTMVGVAPSDIGRSVASYTRLGVEIESRDAQAVVRVVPAASLGARLGLAEGDVIQAINDTEVSGPGSVDAVLDNVNPGPRLDASRLCIRLTRLGGAMTIGEPTVEAHSAVSSPSAGAHIGDV